MREYSRTRSQWIAWESELVSSGALRGRKDELYNRKFITLFCNLFKTIQRRFDASKARLFRGYFPIIKNQGSHKEGFEIGRCEGSFEDHQSKYDASSVASLLLEPAQWPQYEKEKSKSEDFRKTIRAEYEVFHMVARVLIECIAKGLKVDVEEFRKRTDKTPATFRLISLLLRLLNNLLRLLHYPPRADIIPEDCKLPTGEIISTPAHFDTSIMTLLENFNYGGLQIQHPKTEQWFSIDTQPGSFVVNVGKVLGLKSYKCGELFKKF